MGHENYVGVIYSGLNVLVSVIACVGTGNGDGLEGVIIVYATGMHSYGFRSVCNL